MQHGRPRKRGAAAATLVFGAFATLVLSHLTEPLAPLRIITLAVTVFAAWAFSDEMGVRRPLNRAGLIAFAIAALARLQLALGVDDPLVARYQLLYAAFLLLAVLFWSVAFLHRQRELKVVGAVGVFATALPILALIAGHLVVGFGAIVGIGSLMSALENSRASDGNFITTVERIFGLWAYVAAWLLRRGRITDRRVPDLVGA